jgi:hypothetical protein
MYVLIDVNAHGAILATSEDKLKLVRMRNQALRRAKDRGDPICLMINKREV